MVLLNRYIGQITGFPGSDRMKGKTKIEVLELGYAYSGFGELFNGVSFTIKTGEIICILGPMA